MYPPCVPTPFLSVYIPHPAVSKKPPQLSIPDGRKPAVTYNSAKYSCMDLLMLQHESVHLLPCSLNTSCAAAAAKSLQSCPTLCDTIDGSPPCSPIPGILQARTLEWVAISLYSCLISMSLSKYLLGKPALIPPAFPSRGLGSFGVTLCLYLF